MPILARLGAPLLAHAELPGPIDARFASRCRRFAALRDLSGDATEGGRARGDRAADCVVPARWRPHHIVHLGSSDALAMIGDARASGLP